jgi:hypothetical protein
MGGVELKTVDSKTSSQPPTEVSAVGLAAVAFLAYALCDLGHEILGHGMATHLPLGVQAVSVSTVALSTTVSSPIVAAAGPLINFILAASLLLVGRSALSPAGRFFAWLFGSINAFNATGYLLYSAVFGSGDVDVAFDAIAPGRIWRPAVGIAGFFLYAGAVAASLAALRILIRSGVIAERNAERYCMLPYWFGGALLTLGSVFNPVSPWLILSSGAATGFGAMVGLVLLPPLLRRKPSAADPDVGESLRIGRGWWIAGIVAAIVFVGLFGPGIGLRPIR